MGRLDPVSTPREELVLVRARTSVLLSSGVRNYRGAPAAFRRLREEKCSRRAAEKARKKEYRSHSPEWVSCLRNALVARVETAWVGCSRGWLTAFFHAAQTSPRRVDCSRVPLLLYTRDGGTDEERDRERERWRKAHSTTTNATTTIHQTPAAPPQDALGKKSDSSLFHSVSRRCSLLSHRDAGRLETLAHEFSSLRNDHNECTDIDT